MDITTSSHAEIHNVYDDNVVYDDKPEGDIMRVVCKIFRGILCEICQIFPKVYI